MPETPQLQESIAIILADLVGWKLGDLSIQNIQTAGHINLYAWHIQTRTNAVQALKRMN